jgi:hypothetical protein
VSKTACCGFTCSSSPFIGRRTSQAFEYPSQSQLPSECPTPIHHSTDRPKQTYPHRSLFSFIWWNSLAPIAS